MPITDMHALAQSLALSDSLQLLDTVQTLSSLHTLDEVMAVVRHAARTLSGADGVTFVLLDGEQCYYADEEAISPLWKGQRFPATSCISGWAMLHRQSVVIEDIYADARIPHAAYAPTFVKSLAMVPIRPSAPLGAIGAYWAERHVATERELALLQTLANATSITLANLYLLEKERRAVQLREDFLNLASHELRTPLTALQLQVESLARRLDPVDATTHKPITNIRRSTARLTELVQRLLEGVTFSSGEVTIKPQPIDLVTVVREVSERLAETYANAGCALELHLPESLPGTGDPVLLGIMLTDLLRNAAKYGCSKPVSLSLEMAGDHVRLSVKDQGIGIAQDAQRRIFERFERAVSVQHYGGFGLGLWLARQIVVAHGGAISVQSEPDHGATFTVTLPLRSAG